jgi:hypothetical protein
VTAVDRGVVSGAFPKTIPSYIFIASGIICPLARLFPKKVSGRVPEKKNTEPQHENEIYKSTKNIEHKKKTAQNLLVSWLLSHSGSDWSRITHSSQRYESTTNAKY